MPSLSWNGQLEKKRGKGFHALGTVYKCDWDLKDAMILRRLNKVILVSTTVLSEQTVKRNEAWYFMMNCGGHLSWRQNLYAIPNDTLLKCIDQHVGLSLEEQGGFWQLQCSFCVCLERIRCGHTLSLVAAWLLGNETGCLRGQRVLG